MKGAHTALGEWGISEHCVVGSGNVHQIELNQPPTFTFSLSSTLVLLLLLLHSPYLPSDRQRKRWTDIRKFLSASDEEGKVVEEEPVNKENDSAGRSRGWYLTTFIELPQQCYSTNYPNWAELDSLIHLLLSISCCFFYFLYKMPVNTQVVGK